MELWYICSVIYRFYDDLNPFLKANRALIIYGPRRVGKTTLLENFIKNTPLKYRLDSGDNIRIQDLLGSQDFPRIIEYAQGYELIVLDEAQYIPNIGMGIKILVDQLPNLKVIATGSSSFDLANQIGEPLTGRKTTLTLYPIAQLELLSKHNNYDLKGKLEEYLIFGSYPQVLTAKTKEEKIRILEELVSSYIFKDILALQQLKGSKILFDLLKLLAFQVGSEVSLNELATNLAIDVKTVGRYLDLLEKAFVVFRLNAFSRNLRSEVASKSKYFFIDNGIRNAVISQFNGLDSRNDVGSLWENFLMMERIKKRSYKNIHGYSYFWRTYEQREIDLIEEREGKLFPYEFKWSTKNEFSSPKSWLLAYPQAEDLSVVTPNNYLEFIA
jgi:predicted AAA+ superfamily ATPase